MFISSLEKNNFAMIWKTGFRFRILELLEVLVQNATANPWRAWQHPGCIHAASFLSPSVSSHNSRCPISLLCTHQLTSPLGVCTPRIVHAQEDTLGINLSKFGKLAGDSECREFQGPEYPVCSVEEVTGSGWACPLCSSGSCLLGKDTAKGGSEEILLRVRWRARAHGPRRKSGTGHRRPWALD